MGDEKQRWMEVGNTEKSEGKKENKEWRGQREEEKGKR